ncbi:MAG TPA: Uma2 family endonuclease [Gemmataceae bacterium]|nr:Uma2 family endonuclease [Gemmataceae bacterium]
MNGLTWEDYRRISDAFRGIQVRITNDRGKLEIMGTSLVLEVWNELLAMFVRVLAEEAQMTIRSAGHTTLERQDLDRSIEPDHGFYLENEHLVRANSNLDLSKDPPPDLAIETEVSRRAVKQLPIYEALRVPEVWRSDGKKVTFYVLQPDGKYVVAERSRNFPFLRADDLLPFLLKWGQTDETTLLREFRTWVRQQLYQQKPS